MIEVEHVQQSEEAGDDHSRPAHLKPGNTQPRGQHDRQISHKERPKGDLLSRSDIDPFKEKPAHHRRRRERIAELRRAVRKDFRGVVHQRHDRAKYHTPSHSRTDVAFSSGSVQAIVGRNEAFERRDRDQP
jgi:hypothetical protein